MELLCLTKGGFKMEEWYFTFGSNQLDKDGKTLFSYYIRIKARSYLEARSKMFRLRQDKWAFQYSKKEFAGQVETYHLKSATRKQIRLGGK